MRLSKSGNNYDVVVIGGGPGGSTSATMLARQGLSVLLLERDGFPRDHVGESLLPASMPVLEELGVLPSVQQAGFLPKWGATMVWGVDQTPWSWYFKETNQTYPHSYQVWRPTFDQILLENSRSNNVDVREGHRVISVDLREGQSTVQFVSDSGDEQTISARFVVDASGQGGLIGRQLGLRQWDDFFQNLAVYSYFVDGQQLTSPDENNIFIEAYPNGWLWNIPLHNGWASVGAVVDSTVGQEGLKATSPENFLMEQISQAPHTARMLQNAQQVSGPSVVKDWSYVCRPMVGGGYILVGDAACFVDPLFSSGVHLALMSGVLAAAYVTSALKDPAMAQAAGVVYEELYLKEYHHFRELARLFYSSNRTADSYFWEARRIVEADESLSPRNAFIQTVAGQPPRGYERAVLGHGTLPAAFTRSIQEVNSKRSERVIRIESGQANLRRAVPVLEKGARLERKPVLAGGEFQWGYVLITPTRQEGVECSDLVAVLLSKMDGSRTAGEIIAGLQAGSSESQRGQIEQGVLAALEILYVDGAIAELKGL